MIERILDIIKQHIDNSNFSVKGGLISKLKFSKKMFDLDKTLNDSTKALIEQNLKQYIESKNEGLIVNVKIQFNCVYIYDNERYIMTNTLIKAWGDRLYDAYIDEPCITKRVSYGFRHVMKDFISMSRVRRIESSEMFQSDWKRWKRKKFEDRFVGFENTNYKPQTEDNINN